MIDSPHLIRNSQPVVHPEVALSQQDCTYKLDNQETHNIRYDNDCS